MHFWETADISLPFYVLMFLFALIIVPLFSLGVFNFSQAKRKKGISLLMAGFGIFLVFQAISNVWF
ncbi:hypothetical protein [Paenibacillus hunanensis]|uniref:Uncharacterized protein n=1 Tax=Paenibacillus hunanensis TaxID=539262 RepID=A0ABU1J4B4_9BACL|nr:hypothetical protein [Paenibacillus hunanensis]MDR6245303.1 hypothetical protein [Paenibacillus hunanensis]GGJ26626.1 hypothetical protein GCM10008022_39340 [Paenibacillus hunanensis]